MAANATFTMNSGTISGNSSTGYRGSYGGGVYVGGTGTFRIVTGTVYGSDASPTTLRNTAGSGGAALQNDGTAQYGTFSGETWVSNGDLSTADYTIRVINGELIGIGSIAALPVWHGGNAVSLTVPTVFVASGNTVTAQGWQISDDGTDGWTNFTVTTAALSLNGKYLRYYATLSGTTYYSPNTVRIRVISATAREVTIDMYDSYGDGWDGSGALRIVVNGTQLATGVKVSTTASQNTPSGQRGSNTYTFFVDTGDVVELYWVGGSNQWENSFIAYYIDTPPIPAFTSSNYDSWSGSNALVFRLHNTMNSIAGGTLLGSFTVP